MQNIKDKNKINFFDAVQSLHKFLMNSLIQYELFVEVQKQKSILFNISND